MFDDELRDGDKEDTVQNLFENVLKIFDEHGIKHIFVSFVSLVALGQFPLDNVAFLLFLDVVKWFNCTDTRTVRYCDTSLKFFWLGKRLFGGKFLRFMGGPKNETSFL